MHPVPHLVVILRRDDELLPLPHVRRSTVTSLAELRELPGEKVSSGGDGGQVGNSPVIDVVAGLLPRQQSVQRVMKVIAPLRIESQSADRCREQDLRRVQVALGNGEDLPPQAFGALADRGTEVLQKGLGRMIDDGMHRIDPQRIDMELVDPHESVLDEIAPHVIAVGTIEIHGLAPRRLVAVGEVGSEFAEVVPFRSEVVVDDIEDDGEIVGVRRVDQTLEGQRPAVGALRRIGLDAVVAPVPRSRKLGDGEQLDRRHAELFELVEAADDGVKRPFRREGADVQLVDDVRLKWQTSPMAVLPVEIAVHDFRYAMDSFRL